MRIYLKILVGLVAVLIRVGEARAQLDNRVFTSPEPGVLRERLGMPNEVGTGEKPDSVIRENAE